MVDCERGTSLHALVQNFASHRVAQPITRLNGVLAPAASDWLLSQTSTTFSLVMGGFVWGAVVGKYLDQFGPRASCMLGALSLGAGFGLASVGLAACNLPLLYAGGAVWGMSLAWCASLCALLRHSLFRKVVRSASGHFDAMVSGSQRICVGRLYSRFWRWVSVGCHGNDLTHFVVQCINCSAAVDVFDAQIPSSVRCVLIS